MFRTMKLKTEVKKIKPGSRTLLSLISKEDMELINSPHINTMLNITKPRFHAFSEAISQDNSIDSKIPLPLSIRKYWAKISLPNKYIPGSIKVINPSIRTNPTIRPRSNKGMM